MELVNQFHVNTGNLNNNLNFYYNPFVQSNTDDISTRKEELYSLHRVNICISI